MMGEVMMDEQEWEDICQRCGLCCFEKLENDRGTIFFTSTPCRYLDVVTRRCRIYDRRFQVNPECVKLTPELLKEIRWLHADCGYRRTGIAAAEGNDKNISGRRRAHGRKKRGN